MALQSTTADKTRGINMVRTSDGVKAAIRCLAE
jgi:hypothetical protein